LSQETILKCQNHMPNLRVMSSSGNEFQTIGPAIKKAQHL